MPVDIRVYLVGRGLRFRKLLGIKGVKANLRITGLLNDMCRSGNCNPFYSVEVDFTNPAVTLKAGARHGRDLFGLCCRDREIDSRRTQDGHAEILYSQRNVTRFLRWDVQVIK